MSDLITLNKVNKTFRRGRELVHALDGIDLNIQAGEFVAVAGPSGSGKSTLLNIVGAMDQVTTGKVTIANQDVTALNEKGLTLLRADTIGFVFQQFFLQPTLTARENVLLPTLFTRQKHLESRADELLARVGLAERANHLPDELSGGEMQRVAIARALINQPKILLADEPTGNLDSRNAEAIYGLLDELHEDGLTIIVVTHSEELAMRAERRIHLLDGRISDDKTQGKE
tara:strand:+ start:32303 stop:32989 length:687 start_codon:yes stop_codon:yes gene_type:complete